MFNNKIIQNYNKLIYLICLERDLYEYKRNVLNVKFNFLMKKEISYYDYYNNYNKIYFDKIIIINNYVNGYVNGYRNNKR